MPEISEIKDDAIQLAAKPAVKIVKGSTMALGAAAGTAGRAIIKGPVKKGAQIMTKKVADRIRQGATKPAVFVGAGIAATAVIGGTVAAVVATSKKRNAPVEDDDIELVTDEDLQMADEMVEE